MTASLSLAYPPPVQGGRVQFLVVPGTPQREYYALIPAALRPGAEPLVLVHGISRNAPELVLRFAGLAAACGVPLIAPLFRREAYGQYQQVIDPRQGLRADLALFDILDDAARRFGLRGGRIALFGFSGGAQFAHRFAMLHPGRVRACVPVSAGWYTMPDPALAWPLGLADMPLDGPDAAAREVPFHLIVGKRDRQDGDALRREAELDRVQGTNRIERARAWFKALQRAGWSDASSLTVLPRTRHNFNSAHRNGLTETVFRLLEYKGTNS